MGCSSSIPFSTNITRDQPSLEEPKRKNDEESENEIQIDHEIPKDEGVERKGPRDFVDPKTENEESLEPVVSGSKPDITECLKPKWTNFMGRSTTILDTRNPGSQKVPNQRPSIPTGDLWADPDFSPDVALHGCEDAPIISWIRPADICENASLFAEGTTRFDVAQGGVGTCWFLAVLASMAEEQDVIRQVIPADAYKIGTPDYDGVFHCRFWKFGEWVDIYIDDLLPMLNGRVHWGASSSSPQEMWVPLIEKAFAKFHGSYGAVSGGWPTKSFITLTGGVTETLRRGHIRRRKLFKRIKNAISAGCMLACSVMPEHDGIRGLVGGHAYTLTGTAKIPYQNHLQYLVRVRNPHGISKGEWTGPWGDGTDEWTQVDNELAKDIYTKGRADGEFWLPLKDYCAYFHHTFICSLSPDQDQLESSEQLDHVREIFGEWKGETAAGRGKNKFYNQKFVFTITRAGVGESGLASVVLQLIQHQQHRRDNNVYSIRLDILKLEDENFKPTHSLVLNEITSELDYFTDVDISYRYVLEPGEYMLVPSTFSAGQEKQFCIRLFTKADVDCRELKGYPKVFVREADNILEYDDDTFYMSHIEHFFGAWEAGKNAGGQIGYRSHHINPQYTLNISGDKKQSVLVSLLQDRSEPKLAIGLRLYKIFPQEQVPLKLSYIYKNYTNSPKTIDGEIIFVRAYEASGIFMLDPGEYVVLAYSDKPDESKDYVLVICSKEALKCRSYNTA